MNPLTQIKNTQKITKKEIDLGLFEKASWHARFAHSAYIFAGGLDYELTEGDLLAVFAQYGELVDVHLARDKTTGKSKGFAFLAYEDQRSTVLAVDNLSGATVAGRKIRVEHVDNYKKRKAELEGEDPDAVPDEPLPKRQHADAPQQQQQQGSRGRAAAAADDREESPPPVVASRSELGSGRMADAWSAPGSLFSLLAEAKPAPGAAAAAAGSKSIGGQEKSHKHSKHKHKQKKEKKEKHSKKDMHRSRSRSRSRTPSRSHSRSPPRQQQQQLRAAAVGPPRPGGSGREAAPSSHHQQQQQQGPARCPTRDGRDGREDDMLEQRHRDRRDDGLRRGDSSGRYREQDSRRPHEDRERQQRERREEDGGRHEQQGGGGGRYGDEGARSSRDHRDDRDSGRGREYHSRGRSRSRSR